MASMKAFTLMILIFSGTAIAETKTYKMKDMTCGSCVKSVHKQVCSLPGIEKCDVGINTMTLTGTLNDLAISQAVEKAGFSVVSPKTETPKAK